MLRTLGLGLTNAQKQAIMGVVIVLLALLSALDIALSASQQSAIIAVVAALLTLWGAFTANESPTLKTGSNALTGSNAPTTRRTAKPKGRKAKRE